MKTNKSYSKRIKVSKNGKLLTRKSGQNHFNARDRHPAKAAKNNSREFHISNKSRSRYIINF